MSAIVEFIKECMSTRQYPREEVRKGVMVDVRGGNLWGYTEFVERRWG